MARKLYTEEEARERKNARQREYAKRTKYASQGKYNKEHGKSVVFRLFRPQDDDILNHLESMENKTAYFKKLVREDIEKENA